MKKARKQPTNEWWATIVHAFQSHVREETEFLDAYQELVATVRDPETRFLIEMILHDEARHHDLMQQMADAALGDATGEAAAPSSPAVDVAQAAELLGPTEDFLAAEKEDRARLRELARQLEAVRDTSLWPLLVELMEIDTQKHVKILEYVRGRLRAAAVRER